METLFGVFCSVVQRVFLPYLWGMETPNIRTPVHQQVSSYRTYEEWKLATAFLPCHSLLRSYRTYEEWKLNPTSIPPVCSLIVLTVPMRNGNPMRQNHFLMLSYSSYRTYEEWKQHIGQTNAEIIKFLPYLWGMETEVLKTFKSTHSWFLPYLWGMETYAGCDGRPR